MTLEKFIDGTLISVWAVPVFAYFIWLSVVLSVVDFRELRLPNKYVYSAYPIMLVGLLVPAWAANRWDALTSALLCALVGFALFMLLHAVYPAGLGMGDVKLAGVVGLMAGWVSWATALVALMLAFLLSAVVSIVLLITRRANLKSALPLGPFMLGGTILAVLVTAYLRSQLA